jgi:hypothetical protein
VVSLIFGVAAQLKESSSQEKSREDTAAHTFLLAQKTGQAVRDLQRIPSPVDGLHFDLAFEVPCKIQNTKPFCLARNRKKFDPPPDWNKWPGGVGEYRYLYIFVLMPRMHKKCQLRRSTTYRFGLKPPKKTRLFFQCLREP